MSELQITINDIIQRAVSKSLDEYAIEHPNLAAALGQIDIDTDVVAKLRDDPEYRQAEEMYIQARIEIDFLNKVAEIVKTYLPMLLAAI